MDGGRRGVMTIITGKVCTISSQPESMAGQELLFEFWAAGRSLVPLVVNSTI